MNARLIHRLALSVVVVPAFCAAVAAAAPAFAYTISGTVVDATTEAPIVDAELQLWRFSELSQTWVRPGIYASTGATGAYAFTFDGDGLYRVECYNVVGYPDQWWQLAPSASLATALTVPGSVLTDINFRLVPDKPSTYIDPDFPHLCDYRNATLEGTLTASGVPLGGRTISVDYYDVPSDSWKEIGSTTTEADGHFSYTVRPSKYTMYRVRFTEEAEYAGYETYAGIMPRVYLSKPSGPSSARTTTVFTSSVYLKPHHKNHSYPIYLACQRYESGEWVTKKTLDMKAHDYKSYTKCSVKVQLTKKGSWRVRAVHSADAVNAKTLSDRRYIKVY